ncbi:MAG TPA: hypothetical protein VFN30_11375 [Chitinophagaceae bacterium]|nr:hypothetical protein [Chitinophagaceae bacterium]
MATSNNFKEYYKTISDTELLNILDNPGNYQLLAVEAAKEEFAKRQLSGSEIQEARQPIIAKQIQKEKEREKIKAVETKIKTVGHTFIDTINPIQSGIPSTEKTIRLIVIIFGGVFLYQFITEFRTNLEYIKDIPRFPFESTIILLPQILLPIATIAFWKRKTFGWALLTIFLTFTAVAVMWLLFQAINWKPSGFAGLDNLFPRPSPTTYIVQLLFLVGTIYVLSKTNIRKVYSIDKQKMAAIIGITGLVSFFLMFAIF